MIHPPRISNHRPSPLHQVLGLRAALVWTSIRSVVQGEVRPRRPSGFMIAMLASASAFAQFPGYDVEKLIPNDTLIQYSVYGVDSVYLPTSTSGTASSGWFGSGGGIYLNNSVRVRSPKVTVARNLILEDQVAFSGVNKISVNGDFVVKGSINERSTFRDTVQVLGNMNITGRVSLRYQSNDTSWIPTMLVRNKFITTQNESRFGNVFADSVRQTGINVQWLDSVRVSAAGSTFNPTPALLRTNAGAVPQPWSPAVFIDSTRLPGYTIPWLPASGTEIPPGSSFPTKTGRLDRTGSQLPSLDQANLVDCNSIFPGGHCKAGVGGAADTLLPGDYGDLALDNRHLVLGQGFYSFKTVTLSNGGSLISTHPTGELTVVHVRGSFSQSGSGLSHIGPADAIGVSQYGTGAGQFSGGAFLLVVSGAAANFQASDNNIWATISVPHGDAIFNSQNKLFGQVFAKRVLSQNNIDFGDGAFVPIRPPRVITVNKGAPITVRERNPGQSLAYRDTTILVTIDYASAFAIQVDWSFQDSTATVGLDYDSVPGYGRSGTLIIPAGELSAPIRLRILDDNIYEGSEHLRIVLSNPKFAILPDSALTDTIAATILDDETPPTLSFQATTGSGLESVTSPNVNVRLSAAATGPVTVTVVAKGGTATRGGAASDYTMTSPIVVTFPANTTSVRVPFTVVNDRRYEPNETISFVLRSPTGLATLSSGADTASVYTILDDDPRPIVRMRDTSHLEGMAGARLNRGVELYLADSATGRRIVSTDSVSAFDIPFQWSALDGTAFSALPNDTDYQARTAILDTLKAGQTSKVFLVQVFGDHHLEDDETFLVRVQGLSNVARSDSLDTLASVRILNDDALPRIRVFADSVMEPDAPATAILSQVVRLVDTTGAPLTAATAPKVSIAYTWSTSNGTAAAPGDYTAVVARAETIPAGEVLDTLRTTVQGDDRFEGRETFNVTLVPGTRIVGTGSSILSAPATILDDETAPGVCIADTSVSEASATSSIRVFLANGTCSSPLTGLQAPEVPVRFTWSTADSTAKAPGDYAGVSSRSDSVSAGAVSRLLAVGIVNDAVWEGPEVLKVSLAGLVNGTGLKTTARDTIKDNESAPTATVTSVAKDEGNSGTTAFQFLVKLSHRSELPVRFNWSTVGATGGDPATAGTDYAAVSAVPDSVRYLDDSVLLTVNVAGDLTFENDEVFGVRLTPTSNISGTVADAKGTIVNDDGSPRILSITPVSDLEGNSGTKTFAFKLKLNTSSGLPSTFTWSTVGGSGYDSATATEDFVGVTNQSVTIAAGADSAFLSVTVNGDTKLERDESFRVVATATASGNLRDTVFTVGGTIRNDDAQPSVSIADAASTQEPPAIGQSTPASFSVTLSAASGLPVSVTWTTYDSSASSVQKDYKDSTGTLTFAPGETSKTIAIRVLGDSLYERTERFWTTLASATGATLGRDSALGTITDNDTAPTIHVDGITVAEPASGSVGANLRVWIERPSSLPVTFRWVPVDGTARASGGDYDTSAATLSTIPAFSTQVSLVVAVRADNIANEGTEHLRVLLSQVVGASGNDTADTVKIVDATPAPTVRLSGADTLAEASVDVPLTLTMNRPSATAVRVLVRTHDLTATAASGDYRKDSLWLTIPAGGLSLATGSARILQDGLYEDSLETFQVSIDSAEGALRDATPSVVGIRDDEPVPTLSVDSSLVTEPAAFGATVSARFRLRMSGPSQNPVTVSWRTDSVTALPVLDYQHRSGIATFEPGTTLDTAVVTVLGDSLDETDETYLVRLSAPSITGAAKAPTIAKDTALGTILDEDAAPRLFVDDPLTVGEGGQVNFAVRLERPSAKAVSFAWRTQDSAVGAGFAVAGLDYTAAALRRDTLRAGQVSFVLPVTTLTDLIAGEGTERFLVDLSALTNATSGDLRGIGSIAEGTGIPNITIDSIGPVHEADSTVRFRVRLSTLSAVDVLVKFRTVAHSATAGEDFADSTGVLRIPADSFGAYLPVRLLDDLRDEDSLETFTLVLTDSSGAVVQQGTGLVRILDDEAVPTLSVSDTAITEPAALGAVDSARVRIRLSAASDLPVQVSVSTLDGTAGSPLDYIARGAILTIPPRTTEVFFAVAVVGDTLDELGETFRVLLSAPANAVLADPSADVLIRDEDPSPALVLVGTSASEGQTARVEAVLARPSSLDVVLVWRTPALGTATSGLDYAAVPSRRDTIKAGTTRLFLDVPVLADTVANEAGEWFSIRVDTLFNAGLADSSATITILDPTPAPRLTIHAADTIQEGSPWMVFPVTMDRSSATRVAVRFRTQSGTALAGLDFRDTTAILVLPAGSTRGEIRVAVIDDLLYEFTPESLLVVLDSADSALIAVDRAVGWIRDNGDAPPLTLGDAPAVVEGGVLRFPLHLENPSAGPVVVRWRTQDGTATRASGDYVADSGSLVIPAGDTSATLLVRTLVDALWELTETVKIRIDSVQGGFLAASDDSVGVGAVLEEGAYPSVEILSPDTSVREDASARVPVRVRLTRRASVPLSARLVPTTTSTATWGTDLSFVAADLSGDTLRFGAGDSLRTFHLSVAADSLDEFDETAPLTLVALDSMKVIDGLYALTILDDDSAPEIVFHVDTQTVSEAVGRVVVTAHLSRPSGKVIDVWYSVSGSATAGGVDHDMVPFHFTFRTGSDTANVAFTVIDDRLEEDTETVAVQLDSSRNGNLAAGIKQIVRILDNDGAPRAWFADSLLRVREDVGTVSVKIRLDHPSIRPTTFEIVARAGSATLDSLRAGSDAVLGSEVVYRVTVPAFDTATEFVVRIVGDGRVEASEDFRLTMTAGTNGNPATSSAVRVVILDDDRNPDVVITRPADSTRTNQPNHVIEWTWDKVAQKPADTTLLEGWNRIRRCAVDTAGNRGCDSIDVWADFTPPKVTITRPESLFLTNKPVVNVCWKVIDSGATWRKQDSLCGDTTLTEGTHPVIKRACDDVGNCSQDQVVVRVDLTPPTGVFVRPPDSAHVRVTDQPALIRWIDDGDTIWVRDTLNLRRFGWNTFTATYTDKAGNTGTTTVHLFLEIPEVQVGWYLDTDGDGDIDAAVVEFDAPWTSDTLPTFSFRLGDEERLEVESDGWYEDGTRGTPALDKDGKMVTKDGKVVYLAPGIPVTDADGTPLSDSETGKLLVSPVGTPWRDASGNPVYDAQGRELYQVPGPGTEDRSRMVVKFGKNFPYGITSVDSSSDSGRLVVSLPVYGTNGSSSIRDVAASFPMRDSVAPIISKAEVRRTEDYEGMDTLFITPSEEVKLDETRGLVEIKVNGIWHTVPQDSVFLAEDGRIWFLVAPGDSGSPRPGVEIRFLEGVTDLKGNGADPGTSTWTTTVVGPPRPPLLKVELPTPVKSVPAEEMRVNRPGGFVIRATDRSSDDQYSWWKPGAGYVDGSDPDIRNICPDLRFCNGIELYVNRPVRMILYMYDLSGTFVVSQEIDISQEDIDGLRADKLDRVRIQLQWNMRDAKGEVVGSGIYLWRIVSYVRTVEGGVPVMTNQVVKVGVKSVLQ